MYKVEIKLITEPNEIIALWPAIQKVPVVGITPQLLLARAMVGDYVTIKGYIEGQECGFMLYVTDKDVLTVIALYLPIHARKFITAFDSWCKTIGIKRYFAISQRPPKAYARLFDLRFVYTTFMKEII